ncbi:hypothetical protein NXS19_011886 [Fusarium pseudograminearum]|nr:hypothetical protein NXS19_011886 [Fusarium pseudograminearum]
MAEARNDYNFKVSSEYLGKCILSLNLPVGQRIGWCFLDPNTEIFTSTFQVEQTERYSTELDILNPDVILNSAGLVWWIFLKGSNKGTKVLTFRLTTYLHLSNWVQGSASHSSRQTRILLMNATPHGKDNKKCLSKQAATKFILSIRAIPRILTDILLL